MDKEKTASRYFMHKYWGKKPAEGITPLIDRYTKEGDTVIDPFSGYGVFCCEAFLKKRNVIVNDLNPAANFIAKNLFSKEVSITSIKKSWDSIKKELQPFIGHWYQMEIDNISYNPISVLRTKEGLPIQFTFKDSFRKTAIMDIPESSAKAFCEKEKNEVITDWYPEDEIIENSRISAYPNMTVEDLFTKRTLACHARLYSLICKYSEGEEKDLLMIAFTANLANCSKLVPPIKTRGTIAQGAWMTGFYVGETYIENNVLHYFENRLNKAIKGKENYINAVKGNLFYDSFQTYYKITNNDAKHINLPDNSVDYVFTDPPYGDSVPYFEQSIIWNSWLRVQPIYTEEIVISDSNKRNKGIAEFENDINQAFSEIKRVLKDNKYFSLTFHSLSGMEWKAVSNSCVSNNFNMVDYEWLEQKTYPPRQLNRIKSIKGDVLVTFVKNPNKPNLKIYDDDKLNDYICDFIRKQISEGITDTNGIMMAIMKWIFENMIIIGNVDIFKVLNEKFSIDNNGNWH